MANNRLGYSQSELEQRCLARQREADGAKIVIDFSDPAQRSEWTLFIGSRQAMLNPSNGQWLVWDPVHNEYLLTNLLLNCGIIFEYESVVGIKLLPLKDDGKTSSLTDEHWVIAVDSDGFRDPMTWDTLQSELQSGRLCEDTKIWSTRFTTWQRLSDVLDHVNEHSSRSACCKECGAQLTDGAKFCPDCGVRVERTPRCKYCNKQFDVLPRFCSECGERIGE